MQTFLKNSISEGEIMADVLVVTSKVKKMIKEQGNMNTSSETIDILSKAIEQLCIKGIESAKADGRKTVMARDIIIDHL
jgi:histone H3/H4